MNWKIIMMPEMERFELESFRKYALHENLHRSRIMAVLFIGIDILLSSADILSFQLQVDTRFQFNLYLIMYVIMIVVSLFFLMITNYKNNQDLRSQNSRLKSILFTVYIGFTMVWGGVVSLIDQTLYGNLSVFMINLFLCSVIYYIDVKKMIFLYGLSSFVLIFGLPFIQKSSDILIGHYINLAVMILVAFLGSRLTYCSFYRDFHSKMLLQKSNLLLEKESEENRRINQQLEKANLQLKEAALIDELTGIPNRRSFRNYVDMIFEKYLDDEATMGFLMIDIDFFKSYNDTYGHKKGDQALYDTANQINDLVTENSHFFARWGGEEFLYIVVDPSAESLETLAEKIRSEVEKLKIIHEKSSTSYVTVSIGTYIMPLAKKEDIGKGIEYADRALYLAKKSGRNCVLCGNHEW